jgi:hypothetical protein
METLWDRFADNQGPVRRETDIDMHAGRGHVRKVTMSTPLPPTHSDAASIIGGNPGLAHVGAIFHITRERRQVLLDKLAAFAVLLLVLAMIALFALYVAHELPRWRAGQIGGFEIISAPTLSGDVTSAVSTSDAQTPTLTRVPLVLVSMAIEMAIFVGLGLFLRREMDRSS